METSRTVVEYQGTEDEYENVLQIPKRPWTIQDHTTIDKQFCILDADGHKVVYFDYDDVNHSEQDFIAEFIVHAVNNS